MNDAENLKIYKQYIEEGLKKASSNNPFDVINAVDIIKKAVDLKPEEIEGWMCLGELYESLGNNPPGILARIDQYKKAFDSFKKVIELDNKNIEAWFRAGLNSEKMGDLVLEEKQKYEYYERSISLYKKSIELEPDNCDNWLNLGNVYLATERFEEAINIYKKVLEIHTDDIPALYNLGLTYERLGNIEKSIEIYENIIEIDPDDNEVFDILSRLKISQYNSKLENSFQEKSVIANDYLERGSDFLEENKKHDALDCFINAMKIYEEIKNPYGIIYSARYIGAIYYAYEMWEDSKKYNLKALEIVQNQNNLSAIADLTHNLGLLYYKMGDLDKSIIQFQLSIKLYENMASKKKLSDSLSNLAYIYRDTKKYDEALNILKKVYNLDLLIGDERHIKQDLKEIEQTKALAKKTRKKTMEQ